MLRSSANSCSDALNKVIDASTNKPAPIDGSDRTDRI